MSIENMIMACLTVMFGLVQTAFWRWVSNVEQARNRDAEKIDSLEREIAYLRAEIYQKYQSKEDSHRDSERIMHTLNKIERDLNKISDKLDRKADK